MDTSEEPQSIRSLYETAEAKRRALEASPDTRSSAYASDVAEALSLYAKARSQISAADLFSPNEGVEDVSTSSLPYLLLDFQAAELVQRTPFVDAPQRKLVVRKARAAYELFLSLVDGYGLVKGQYSKMLERYRDEPERFVAVGAGGDAAARREAKIANFKAEKELKGRLETLRANPRYLDSAGNGGGDEELVRQVHLAHVDFSVHTTFQALDALNREWEMLRMAPEVAPSHNGDGQQQGDDMRGRGREGNDDDDASWRLDQPMRQRNGAGAPLLSTKGKPLQPFTLVGSRADLRKGVFRPGHNLPTMSIDEYLEEERRRGNILEGGTDPAKPEVDEDDMEAVDRETYKAREWDEFKDSNPRGAGNTMNMG